MKNKSYSFISLLFTVILAFGQNLNHGAVSSERYFTDNEGNILMHVNIWGHVKNPGHHIVYDGIDLTNLISIVGGPLAGANLKKVRLLRQQPDKNGRVKYEINLEEFYNSGSRDDFVKILPNDTIIIPETTFSTVTKRTNIIPIILQLLSIYIQIDKN